MCGVVSEYGMPYCVRLLQADILPQKLSRRSLDGHAARRIGRGLHQHRHVRDPATRSVSAMARSSPKLGSVTMMPSIVSRFFLNRSAHRAASARVSTAPNLVSSGPGATTAVAGLLDRRNHFRAAALGQVVREETPISDDHAECHRAWFAVGHGVPLPRQSVIACTAYRIDMLDRCQDETVRAWQNDRRLPAPWNRAPPTPGSITISASVDHRLAALRQPGNRR